MLCLENMGIEEIGKNNSRITKRNQAFFNEKRKQQIKYGCYKTIDDQLKQIFNRQQKKVTSELSLLTKKWWIKNLLPFYRSGSNYCVVHANNERIF